MKFIVIIDTGKSRRYMEMESENKDTGLYRAQCSNPFGNTRYERRGYIGLFKTRELAHQAWRTKKHEYACKLAELQVDPFIKQALLTRYL